MASSEPLSAPGTTALPDEGPTQPKRFARIRNCCSSCWHAYERGLGWVAGGLARGSAWVGETAATRPVLVLVISLLIAILTCVPWLRFRIEDEADVLWVPQNGKAHDDKLYVETYYPSTKRGASFYSSLKEQYWSQFGGDDALQIPVTWEMFHVHNLAMALSVSEEIVYPGQTPRNVTFTDICYRKRSGGCYNDGYLNFWYNNFTQFLLDVGGSLTDPLAGNQTAFREQVSQLQYPDGQGVSLQSVFGGTTFEFDPSFKIASAKVIAFDYVLDNSVTDETAKRWHDAFKEMALAQQKALNYTTFTFITGSSVGEELSASINNDMMLVIISFILFIAIAILFLSKWDTVVTRTTLAIMGVGVVCLGIFSGWGWGMLFGMPFTPLQQVSPFVLLGMGVDVLFILVKAHELIMYRQPDLTLKESFGKLMGTAGISVQVTLLASAVAFALGAISNLNSVRWFSAYATLNTVMILVLMMTTFIACFVLTERRIKANRRDLCCCKPCIRAPGPATAAAAAGDAPPASDLQMSPLEAPKQQPPVRSSTVDSELEGSMHRGHTGYTNNEALPPVQVAFPSPIKQHDTTRQSGSSDSFQVNATVVEGVPAAAVYAAAAPAARPRQKEAWMKKMFRVYYAPALSIWWVKIIVVLIFVAYSVVSFVGIYQMSYGQPLSDLAPDGSYLQAYDIQNQATYAQQVGLPTGLYFRNLDFSDPVNQGKMLAAMDRLLDSEFINASTSGFMGNWYIDLNHWAAGQGVTMTASGNCTNPLTNRATGNLAGVVNPTDRAQPLQGCIPQALFYPTLRAYLSIPENRYHLNDIIFVDGNTNGTILTAQFTVMQEASADDDKFSMNFIHDMRKVEKAINAEFFSAELAATGTYACFTYNFEYIYNEGDALLPDMALEYFLLALLGVGLVVLVMMVNPWTALLLMCAVGMVDLFLFGELWILDIKFNQVSIINMIMATGLATDYSVYFAQKFMTVSADGTRNGRMQQALADTGSAVFLGGITALIGTVPMAFSKSVIIRTFFKLIFGTIIFAMLVGLMFMPVVFSVVGPPRVSSVLAEEDVRSEEELQQQREEAARKLEEAARKQKEAEGVQV